MKDSVVLEVKDNEVSPFDGAGLFKRWTFTYALPLFQLGSRRPLTEGDLPGLAERDKVEKIAKRIERCWERKTGSLMWALFIDCFRSEMIVSFLYFFVDFSAMIGMAAMLGPFINWLSSSQRDAPRGIAWGLALVGTGVMNTVVHHQAFFILMRTGWNLRLGVIFVIHEKLLRMRGTDLGHFTAGTLYSMVSNDVQRFDNLVPFIHAPTFGIIFAIPAVLVLMARIVGFPAAAAGCGVIVLSVVVQVSLAFRFQKLRARTSVKTDARVRLLDEIVAGILAVKAAGWETGFETRVSKLRHAETTTILLSQYCKALISGLFFCTVIIAAFATYAVLFLVDRRSLPKNGLKLGDVVSIISMLNALRQLICFCCALCFMSAPELVVALRRIDAFLNLPEAPVLPRTSKALASCGNASFAWPSSGVMVKKTGPREQQSLAVRGVTVDVDVGDVLLITGPVASGKSSFLEGLFLGELDVINGTASLGKDVAIAYAPQRPWLFAGTLRENVGAADAILDDVLNLCELQTDVDALPGGVDVLLGDRGITLSGGQRARVGWARAVAAALSRDQRTVVVCDDVTSALDPKVARAVVTKSFQVLLATNRVAIVVASHSPDLLRYATKILHLNPDGTANTVEHPTTIVIPEEPSSPIKKMKKMPSSLALSPSQVVIAEDRETGDVSWSTWLAYARGAGYGIVAATGLLFICGQVLLVMSDAYLLTWSSASRRSQRRPSRLAIFAALTAATSLVSLGRAMLFYVCAMRGANALHTDAVHGILRAPLWFLTGTPRGRIMNRVSSDVGNVDELLAQALFDLAQLGLLMIAIVVAACVAVPFLIAVVPVLAYSFLKLKVFTSKSMTELKRLDQTTRSPAVARFADTVDGLVSIRASPTALAKARSNLLAALDMNARSWFWWLLCQRFLGFCLDSMCLLFYGALILLAVVVKLSPNSIALNPQLVALGLLYASQLAANFQWTVRQCTLAESFMASVERLLHYGTRLPKEDDDLRHKKEPPENWPATSRVQVKDLRVRYRKDLPDVLTGFTASFPSGSTIGICGRTGSGKSSFALALARLNIISGGVVLLDGVDTATISLAKLRSCVSIIPQEPLLFSGTVRDNVDPLREKSEEEARSVLLSVGFGRTLKEDCLDARVDEGAANFSVGQRQLICLARALLLDRRVLSLDEATASTDWETDALIQKQLRQAAAINHATAFIIAHRIQTIVDADLVVVLDQGRLVEMGPPADLLADPNSSFYAMQHPPTHGDDV